MTSSKLVQNQFRNFIITSFSLLPTVLSKNCTELAFNIFKKTRYTTHVNFLNNCIHKNLVPKGFKTYFHPAAGAFNSFDRLKLSAIDKRCAYGRMRIVLDSHRRLISQLTIKINKLEDQLRVNTHNNNLLFNLIHWIIHGLNRELYNLLSGAKKRKIEHLKTANNPKVTTSHVTDNESNLVVCIPPDLTLSEPERSVLSKGLKFIPLRASSDKYQLLSDAHRFFRSMRLQLYFYGTPANNDEDDSEFPVHRQRKSTWTPPSDQSKALDLYIKSTENQIQNIRQTPLNKSNLSKEEWRALFQLKKRQDIVIKPADKGGAVVVWDKRLYIEEASKQLNNATFYNPRTNDPIICNNEIVKETIEELIDCGQLPSSAKNLRIYDSDLGKPCLYLLPKIHKLGNPGRPIVSACSCPTELISDFLDTVFQPIVANLPSFIKDTSHMLKSLDSLVLPNEDHLLFTMDVSSLYTSIPHADGLSAISFFLNKKANLKIPASAILRLTELVLNLNSFEFNGQFFDQISGVAMGTKMGPSYACIFMGHLEHLWSENYKGISPEYYRRYIDDCIGITKMNMQQLQSFIDFVGNFHSSIKFTSTIHRSAVNFLDIQIKLKENKISTSIFYKSTDSHSFLMYSSSHPESCKSSIPFSQLLRLKRLCSDEADFLEKSNEMLDFFRRRSYPETVLISAVNRIKGMTRQDTFKSSVSDQCDRSKFILTFHPHNFKARQVILKNRPILMADPLTQQVFKKPPLFAFRRDRSLRDILVRSHLPTMKAHIGTKGCNRNRCNTCPYVMEINNISFPLEKFLIKDGFTCTSRNVIYAILCKRCNKIYVGETGRRLGDRFREHLYNINKQAQCPVSKHFNSVDHNGISDIAVTGILYASNTHDRIHMENRLIKRSH